jgi:hypothetical protein
MIIYNIGKNFISKKFKQYIVNINTIIKSVSVKAHNLINIIECYYGPLWHIYHIITFKILGIDKDIVLQIAFKAINNSIGLNGLIPTLLVFKAYP